MEKKSTGSQVSNKVAATIHSLTQEGKGGKRSPWATAMLAKLRRAAGTSPGQDADIWEVTLQNSDGNTKGEWAIHTALTLFALHQQGSSDSVNESGLPFGTALRTIIAQDPNKEQGVIRRFNAFATADSMEELTAHARGLVQLMKQADVKMDYPTFANDLYWYQIDSSKNNTRMKWGRDFYKTNNISEGKEK